MKIFAAALILVGGALSAHAQYRPYQFPQTQQPAPQPCANPYCGSVPAPAPPPAYVPMPLPPPPPSPWQQQQREPVTTTTTCLPYYPYTCTSVTK